MSESNSKFSESIKNLCTFIQNVEKEYEEAENEIKRMENLQQDYLHLIEFQELSESQKLEAFEQLKKCREARRAYKNQAQVLRPIVTLFTDTKYSTLLSSLQGVLGATRKVEKSQGERIYIPRVLDLKYFTYENRCCSEVEEDASFNVEEE